MKYLYILRYYIEEYWQEENLVFSLKIKVAEINVQLEPLKSAHLKI